MQTGRPGKSQSLTERQVLGNHRGHAEEGFHEVPTSQWPKTCLLAIWTSVAMIVAGANPSVSRAEWTSWERSGLGRMLPGRQSCVARSPGRIKCVAMSLENFLLDKNLTERSVWGWTPAGGRMVLSSPLSCVSRRGGRRVNCFAKGAQHQMMHRAWDESWHRWEDLGGRFTSAFSCVSSVSDRIDCFAKGIKNHLMHRWWDGSWHAWVDHGGVLTSDPTCVSWGPNRLDCLANGGDNHMYHRAWDGSRWTAWQDVGGRPTSAPSCVSSGDRRIDCFALELSASNQALSMRWRP